MHELLLHASLPNAYHPTFLSILAGLAAMQPIPLLEHHHIYKPNRPPGASRHVQVGAVQDVDVSKGKVMMEKAMAGDLFYLRVVRKVHEKGVMGTSAAGKWGVNDATIIHDTAEKSDEMEVDSEAENHTSNGIRPTSTTPKPSLQSSLQPLPSLEFRDLPEPTRQRDRAVTSRLMTSTPITSGSPSAFMKALDYTPISTYYTEGHRLTQGNISLHLYRVLVPTEPSQTVPPSEEDESLNRAQTKLLDPSGEWLLEATIRVQDGSKVETMVKGMNELLALKETLRGVVELEMAERLALDTRVR